MTKKEEVAALLVRISPKALCDDCIADELELTVRQHANHKTRELAQESGFSRRKEKCPSCQKEKEVISYELDISDHIGGVRNVLASVFIDEKDGKEFSFGGIRLYLLLCEFNVDKEQYGYSFLWANKQGVPEDYYKNGNESRLTRIPSKQAIEALFKKAVQGGHFLKAFEGLGDTWLEELEYLKNCYLTEEG